MVAISEQLQAWRGGDAEAFRTLLPQVYAELRRIAGRLMHEQSPAHTLQPTALANEAWLKLAGSGVICRDHAHFMAVAARAMRQILVDHARALSRKKRDGGVRVSLTLASGELLAADENLLALEDGLVALETEEPRAAQVTELHYYGGMTYAEMAEVVGVSPATIDRDLRFARAWLADRMANP